MKRLLLLGIVSLMSNILNAQGWGQTQKIVPDDRRVGQQFGSALDIDGNFAIIGLFANGDTEEAYVFVNDGSGNWVQSQKLESPEPNQYDHFGATVAISGDYIFVGAWGEHYDSSNSNYMQSAGAVYIFKKLPSGLFTFEQKIVASDREALNAFGYAIALSNDYAVISPARHDYDASGNNFIDDAGAAYIFERDSNGIWNEAQKIVASDRAVQDFFGQISLAVDGNYIAVGAYAEDDDENGTNTIPSAGSAYIFERDNIGMWNEVQKIAASDRAQGEFFGWSISLDGNHLLVGSNQNNNFTGAAYVFEKDGNDIWNEVQKLTASNGVDGDRFGQDIDIDGNRIIIGAHFKDIGSPGNDGAAYIFEKESGVWNERAFIYDAFNSTGEIFGYSVAISGAYAFAGAYQDGEDENEENNLTSAGAAFIFDANEPNTLNIVENRFETYILAYPNPTKGLLNINLNNFFEQININVYSSLGQLVLKKKFRNKNSCQINLSIPNGLYFVEVKLGDGMSSVFKIIKE